MVKPLSSGWIALLLAGLLSLPAQAIDNPDVPNFAANFETRAKPFEDRIGEVAGGARDLGRALEAYHVFLDRELNRAYSDLQSRLMSTQKRDLQNAQRRWMAWRDAETTFIDRQWTLVTAGSSSTLSRGLYRCELVKQRTISLLRYMQEIPAGGAPR